MDWYLILKYMTYEEIKEVQRTTDLNFSPYYDELPRLINHNNYKIAVNIGIFAGGQEKKILDTTNIQLVIGIDPYLEYKPGQIGMGTISKQEEFDIMHELAIKRLDHKRFVLIRETSDDAIYTLRRSLLGDGLIDILFIDGLHEAKQLQKDIYNYTPLVRKGGIVAIHDWNHPTFPELTPIINNFAASHGVKLIIGPLHFVHVIKTW
jgi:hypothetical protein